MADIKTVDRTKAGIKTLDKDLIRAKRKKDIYMNIKKKSKASYVIEEESPEEYASAQITQAGEFVMREGEYQFASVGKKSAVITKQNILEAKERMKIKRNNNPVASPGTDTDVQLSQNTFLSLKEKRGRHAETKELESFLLNHQRGRAKSRIQHQRRILQRKMMRMKMSHDAIDMQIAKSGYRRMRGTSLSLYKGAKHVLLGTKAAIVAIIAGGWISVIVIVVCSLFGSAMYLSEDGDFKDFQPMLVNVAQAEIGNEGGEPYWSWYGFRERVDWCAIFVSWCGEQCGYLDAKILPKFAVVSDGADWFKAKKQWKSRRYTPKSGDIVFFDWEDDGTMDHVGIVEKCDGKIVYTIEGNSGDVCRRLQYETKSKKVCGYGVIVS